MKGIIALTILAAGTAAFAQAPIQLDESCMVTIGNQTAVVRPDGSFFVRNISVFQTRDTGIAPELHRVRATCNRNGIALTGQSDFLSLVPGDTVFIADIFPTELDPIPASIDVSAPAAFIPLGATVQLSVTAHFADGTTEDRTLRSDGTTYLSTNPNLLSVTEDGIVTGQNTGTSPQTGTIAVLNEGNLGTINFTAVGPSNDFDNDGMPNDYEDLFGLNKFFNDANLDLDSDGLTNIQEFNLGTIPNNPDTDGDGIIDGLDGDPLHPEESPPTVVITSPVTGDPLIEGQTILFSVDASDDGLLVSVELSTDTGFSATFTEPPFETDFVVPPGITGIVFSASATDGVPNVSTATPVTKNVIPDPLTTVIGSVVDPDGFPVEGAALTTNGDLTETSLPNGTFSIPDVPTILGDIVVMASAEIAGQQLFGNSDATVPVRGGTTDIGIIVLAACSFEPNLGINLFQFDDDSTFVGFGGGFAFPYLGTARTGIFVNSNGNLTFDFGDTTFDPFPIPDYVINGQARISPAFVDFDPEVAGGVFANQFADRFVVTWSHVPLFAVGGDNTVQVVLFSDGRMQFVFNGITANGTQQGADLQDISVAVTPGGTPSLLTVDYSADTPFSSAGQSQAVIENFNPSNLFDLDFQCVSWRPNGSGGFDVQVSPLAPSLPGGTVSGVVVDGDGIPIPDCPLTITSSGDPNFSGVSQSSADGTFMVTEIPIPGGINVNALDGTKVIGTASGLLWNEAETLDLVVAPIPVAAKE